MAPGAVLRPERPRRHPLDVRLWPLYRTTDQEDGDFHFHRRDGLLVVWRHQCEREPETRHTRASIRSSACCAATPSTVGPPVRYPALMDSLVPATAASWRCGPRCGVFRWDTSPGGHLDWSLLWGLASRERGHLRPPWFIDARRRRRTTMAAEADTLHTGVTGRTGGALLSTLQTMGEGVSCSRPRAAAALSRDRPGTHRGAAGPGRHRHGRHRRHPVALRRHGPRGAVGRSAAQREPERARTDRRARHDQGDGPGDDGLPARRPHRLIDRRRARFDDRLRGDRRAPHHGHRPGALPGRATGSSPPPSPSRSSYCTPTSSASWAARRWSPSTPASSSPYPSTSPA